MIHNARPFCMTRMWTLTLLVIYIFINSDWLDNGNNKKALQEADKVLKKQPNFQCAKV